MSYLSNPNIYPERAIVYVTQGQEVFEAIIRQKVSDGPPPRVDLSYWSQSLQNWVTVLNVAQGDTLTGRNVWSYVGKNAGLDEMDAPNAIDSRCVTYIDANLQFHDAAIQSRGAGQRPILQLRYYDSSTGQFVVAPDVPHREEAGRSNNVWRWIGE